MQSQFNGAVEIQPTLFSGVSKMSSYFRRQYIGFPKGR